MDSQNTQTKRSFDTRGSKFFVYGQLLKRYHLVFPIYTMKPSRCCSQVNSSIAETRNGDLKGKNKYRTKNKYSTIIHWVAVKVAKKYFCEYYIYNGMHTHTQTKCIETQRTTPYHPIKKMNYIQSSKKTIHKITRQVLISFIIFMILHFQTSYTWKSIGHCEIYLPSTTNAVSLVALSPLNQVHF